MKIMQKLKTIKLPNTSEVRDRGLQGEGQRVWDIDFDVCIHSPRLTTTASFQILKHTINKGNNCLHCLDIV